MIDPSKYIGTGARTSYAEMRKAERADIIEKIQNTSASELAVLTHETRLVILRILTPDVFEDTSVQPGPDNKDTLKAIESILQSTPYPAAEADRDVKVAKAFLQEWNNLRASGEVDTPVLQAHMGDTGPFIRLVAQAAMRSMGLVPHLITVHTSEKPQEKFNEDIDGGGDFIGLAHVYSQLDDESHQLNVFITVNEDNPFLRDIHPDNETAIIELAGAVFHEICHVEEQVALLHRESLNNVLLADWMGAQRHQVGILGRQYDVYRSLLSERQAYHRQHAFMAMAAGYPVLPESDYCRGDKRLHEISVEEMREKTEIFMNLFQAEINLLWEKENVCASDSFKPILS